MNQFVKKASSKISKLSDEQILGIIDTQSAELRIRNLALDNSYIGYMLVQNDGTVMYMNRQAVLLVPSYKRKKYTNTLVHRVVMDDGQPEDTLLPQA